MTRDEVAAMAAQAMGNPLIAEDLAGGFPVHTEIDDWEKFAVLVAAGATALQRIEQKLIQGGAALPVPQTSSGVENGLSIALMLVREELAAAQRPVDMAAPQRPECFERAMDFLGDPEETELRRYIERLERTSLAVQLPAYPRDAEIARLRTALQRVDQTLTVPAAEYVPAIGDAFVLIRDALKGFGAAEAADLPAVIEQIARQWDGCLYDGEGSVALDIGASIREAGERLIGAKGASA